MKYATIRPLLSIAQCAGQVLVVGFEAAEPPHYVMNALTQGELGGVIWFRRNVQTLEQVAEVNARLESAGGQHFPPLIAVDQEGGRVSRLSEPFIQLPPMRKLGELDDVAHTKALALELGKQLRGIGFTADFAPVLDVDTNPENPVIGDRAFGCTPDVVVRHGRAFAEGLMQGGVLACGKHFPGHGDTLVDSHLALPVLEHERARLESVELAPFRALAHVLPMLMTAHVVVRALDEKLPATLSKTILQGVLRGELGYTGVIVSDDLEMKAIAAPMSIEDAAVQAIEAGCDALLVCSDLEAAQASQRALIQKAESDSSFAQRLEDAAQRFVALRGRTRRT